jgi:hypothetical protein
MAYAGAMFDPTGALAAERLRRRREGGSGDVWWVEGVSDYGGKIYHGVGIIEFRDGKIWKETRYYAEPFELQDVAPKSTSLVSTVPAVRPGAVW